MADISDTDSYSTNASVPHIPRGRLAPSPTGFLHLGNAWAFLIAWLATRSRKGSLILRIEDIDPERSRMHYTQALIEDLHWLGLDWDCGPDTAQAEQSHNKEDALSFIQSERYPYYEAALEQLTQKGLVYPCYCSRKEVRALASAPHGADAAYPGTCRALGSEECARLERQGRRAALRLRCAEMRVQFTDLVYGAQSTTLADCGGDFALRRSDGVIAYQLAVVIDDAAMQVNQVVRGRDLLSATPRQLALYQLLGLEAPEYLHVPLLLDNEGERLAKRHDSLTLHALRSAGINAAQVCGYLGWRAGLCPLHACMPKDLLRHFSPEKLPHEDQLLPDDLKERLSALNEHTMNDFF